MFTCENVAVISSAITCTKDIKQSDEKIVSVMAFNFIYCLINVLFRFL